MMSTFIDDTLEHFKSEHLDVDLIMNFACPASPPRYQAMPIETMMTCVVGTKNMLDIARQYDAVIVHASTSEVYGDPTVSPQIETYRGNVNSWGIRANYDEGKRAAEALAFDYIHKFDVDVRVLRIFNTYGPQMDANDGRVISNFINQALRGEALTIYGHGQQTRSFCYVDDLVDGIVTLATMPRNQALNSPINLGNPNEFTIEELAEKVAIKLCAGRLVVRKEAMPLDDPSRRCPDITKARDLLRWEPKVQLDEGLDHTIEYFKRL